MDSLPLPIWCYSFAVKLENHDPSLSFLGKTSTIIVSGPIRIKIVQVTP